MDKLKSTKDEKDVMSEEFQKTRRMIEKYNAHIASLEAEINEMRRVITENTVPVHKVYDKDLQESNAKNDRH